MTNIDRHPPGSFCWIELNTTDQNAAKTFYSKLFGWQPDDSPMGPDAFYTTFKIDGRSAAAAFSMDSAQRAQGVPPHWGIYMQVANADDAAAKAKQLGGNVIAGPFDVMEYGRMAVLQDPTGAYFCVWQSKTHTGIQIAHVNGALCWADLSTDDPKRAEEFYGGLFGWQFIRDAKDPSGYLHIQNGEHMIGGVPPGTHRKPGVPPHWLAYIQVDDVDAVAKNAAAMGAKLLLPPMSMEGVGKMSVVADPQGAVFALFKSARG
jgi:predicted enzyme related to lactoylglutathione lyase